MRASREMTNLVQQSDCQHLAPSKDVFTVVICNKAEHNFRSDKQACLFVSV